MIDDPTTPGPRSPNVRPRDHQERRDGATREPEALAAYRRACARQRDAQTRSALHPLSAKRRGYTYEEHERCRALRERAAGVHAVADALSAEIGRGVALSLYERAEDHPRAAELAGFRAEACALEAEAMAIVPYECWDDNPR